MPDTSPTVFAGAVRVKDATTLTGYAQVSSDAAVEFFLKAGLRVFVRSKPGVRIYYARDWAVELWRAVERGAVDWANQSTGRTSRPT